MEKYFNEIELTGWTSLRQGDDLNEIRNVMSTIYNMGGRVVSGYTNSSRRRVLYIRYNTDANAIIGL